MLLDAISLAHVTEQKRRRLDIALDPEFSDGIEDLPLEEVRQRRDLAEEVERELSYYRRLFHGRMDLLAFELRRRRGEETRTLIEALPEILSAGLTAGGDVGTYRHLSLEIDLPEVTGRREMDHILDADGLARIATLDEIELAQFQIALAEAETAISEPRRRLHKVIDTLQAEIIDRYKRGLADSELIS